MPVSIFFKPLWVWKGQEDAASGDVSQKDDGGVDLQSQPHSGSRGGSPEIPGDTAVKQGRLRTCDKREKMKMLSSFLKV